MQGSYVYACYRCAFFINGDPKSEHSGDWNNHLCSRQSITINFEAGRVVEEYAFCKDAYIRQYEDYCNKFGLDKYMIERSKRPKRSIESRFDILDIR